MKMRNIEKIGPGWYRAYCWGAYYTVIRDLRGYWVTLLDAEKTPPMDLRIFTGYPSTVGRQRTLKALERNIQEWEGAFERRTKFLEKEGML